LAAAQVEFEMNLCSNVAVNSDIFIALGSNMGDLEGNLLKAVAEIGRLHDTRVTALSPFYNTEPVGGVSQNNFLNAALRLTSSIPPDELLAELLRIELSIFGRKRNLHWGPRSIDLDLLFYGCEIIHQPPKLLLPHPRLHERRFVLAPLADIAPEFIHPVYGKSIRELLAELPPGGKVTKI
jgi:2-amino-4-hydroxy-6-hydroxymethyldihydropteridine diphosphokinase